MKNKVYIYILNKFNPKKDVGDYEVLKELVDNKELIKGKSLHIINDSKIEASSDSLNKLTIVGLLTRRTPRFLMGSNLDVILENLNKFYSLINEEELEEDEQYSEKSYQIDLSFLKDVKKCLKKESEDSTLAEWHKTQVGGNHYKQWAIPVIDFCQANKLTAAQSSIVRYVCRYKSKNGLEDLNKAVHYLDYLIAEIQDGKMEQLPADLKFKIPVKDFCFYNNLNNVQSKIIEDICYYNCRSTTPLNTLIEAKNNTLYLIQALENEDE